LGRGAYTGRKGRRRENLKKKLRVSHQRKTNLRLPSLEQNKGGLWEGAHLEEEENAASGKEKGGRSWERGGSPPERVGQSSSAKKQKKRAKSPLPEEKGRHPVQHRAWGKRKDGCGRKGLPSEAKTKSSGAESRGGVGVPAIRKTRASCRSRRREGTREGRSTGISPKKPRAQKNVVKKKKRR